MVTRKGMRALRYMAAQQASLLNFYVLYIALIDVFASELESRVEPEKAVRAIRSKIKKGEYFAII